MSNNWIKIIFLDPNHIPNIISRKKAELYLKKIAPNSEEIRSSVSRNIQFFDAGSNFNKVSCPYCNNEIQIDWWQEKMDNNFTNKGFVLTDFVLPCCTKKSNLNLLEYDFDQGFGRYSLEAMNPDIRELSKNNIEYFKSIFHKDIKVIYQHM